MKRMKKWMALLCAALLLCGVAAISVPVEEAYGYSQQEGEYNIEQYKKKAEEYKKQMEAMQDDKNRAIEYKLLLDQRNAVLQDQIDTVQLQIQNTEEVIARYEVEEKAQYELFCKQVRQEEERGTISYWSVLFKATGFADLLSRMDFITEVMEYNQRVIADLRQLREQLTQSKTDLQKQKESLDETQTELEEQIAEATRVMNEFLEQEDALQKLIDAEEEGAAQEEAFLKEWLEQNPENKGDIESDDTQGVLNGLIWPSNARYITDKFGWRDAPTAGASSYHQGVDIGAPYNSNVYAAQSGQVIQAGWNGSYGYSITIAHDFGVATLYGHLNDYHVYVGDYVSRGQVIGLCGSTGVSTGPHIHYEVRLNGERIDPMPYLPGYIPWW
ncbi:MAG: hypothetical protein E7446_09040 [Ruminococcaceae bacterium]|nr:hypothetical protein [Oscillospiraceae bacterium]